MGPRAKGLYCPMAQRPHRHQRHQQPTDLGRHQQKQAGRSSASKEAVEILVLTILGDQSLLPRPNGASNVFREQTRLPGP